MRVFIIAEAGVNHNGDFQQALALVDAAVEAGADAVKFQTFDTDELVTETAKQADYQRENSGLAESQYAMLKRLELPAKAHVELMDYCRQKGIEFMSTPFDDSSIDLLHNLGMRRWKIPSGELLSVPYLRHIARFNQATILSTGMGDLEEVAFAVHTLLEGGLDKSNLTILHANTAYPTPYKDVNLKAMLTLKETFEVKVGLSDHSLGIEVPIAAAAMGAKIIEKHFTLDRSMQGPDHAASLEPLELKQMVAAIRHIEQALGSGEKILTDSEAENLMVARKRIVARRKIEKGEVFSPANLTLKRNNYGRFAREWDRVVGSYVERDYAEGEAIES
ncbi:MULTISPECIES: N-acetylneuraminate synthase [Thiomicrorhabdus]|uniref:N-acetylneuraminate synthase n=1 Tax=Thiomicrorhabdus heinhorstiae TaxID=2748010 RepID=A0ABS0C052_9GAMM|nr:MULTISPECIES: N-acetylneuraminate synthase [Thiomicrorhabdus]MBF6058670.1 N-acetylneuraminate synthase [Thiomicrorhabdus heinhorstiae]